MYYIYWDILYIFCLTYFKIIAFQQVQIYLILSIYFLKFRSHYFDWAGINIPCNSLIYSVQIIDF